MRPDVSGTATFAANRKAVMVIYGQDEEANTALFDWLRAVGFQPREWGQLVNASDNASPYIGQVLEQALQSVQAVVAFFTPDEHVKATLTHPTATTAWRLQARPNVLIETGMALISHPTRTVIAVLGPQELPSDIAGRHYVRLNCQSSGPLHDLAGRLSQAGCEVDLSGNAWLNPARFPDRDRIILTSRNDDQRVRDRGPGEGKDDTVGEEARRIEAAWRAREDYEARQVRIETVDAGPDGLSHVYVTWPAKYTIEQVETRAAVRRGAGWHIEWYGNATSSAPVESHGGNLFYSFEGARKLAGWTPIIRFVDSHGNLYCQYENYTERFPIDTDWLSALHGIQRRMQHGPPL